MMRENESDPGDGPDFGGPAPGWGNWMPPSAYGPAGWEPAPYQPPPRHGRRLLVYLLVAAVAAGFGAGVTFAISRPDTASSSAGVSSHDIPAQHDNPAAVAAGLNQARVEKKLRPGLVDITATLQYSSETAEGTGMILSADGLVLTNNHVIDNSTSVKATLVGSGRIYTAKVLGYDSTQDVALLQLEGAVDLPVVTLGNSDQITIGMPVLALGNAQGRGGATPAPGIINALDRSINASDSGSGITEYLHDMEQTSAQIQQGDSGGALADNTGQVVGMITAANTTSGQAGGTIGFAIPINTALSIARQIIAGQGSSTVYLGEPGFLGVAAATSTSADPKKEASDEQGVLEHNAFDSNPDGPGCIQSELQVIVPADIAPAQSGALIVGVFCDTAVSATGLTSGDVITAVNGQPVTTPASLGALVQQYHPGDAVSVSWTSVKGGKHTASITLGAGPVR
ncbi:MAG TPA: trypsin-like peptidase domain-containing protein [Streptosporangiaceae bacterium]|nr:trypsin-like peptidase domain-containing protein [Streptosporangiaceae bacterium]